jgi:TolB-like protein
MIRSALFLLLAASPALAEKRIAVSYFDNNSNDKEWDPIRKGLADMLITDLSELKSITVVEREKLNLVLDELKLQKTKLIDPNTAVKLGKGLGAQAMLTGSYQFEGDQMRIDARVIDVETNQTTGTKVQGKKDEFFELEKELVEHLVKTLALTLETSEKAKLRKSQTESFEAFSQYSTGLDAADRGDRDAALASFQKALESDPKYKAARSAIERLQAAIGAHDQVRASGFESKLAELNPASPTFYKDCDRLAEKHGGTNREKQHNNLILLAYLAEKGYRPSEHAYAGNDFLANPNRYFELDEDLGALHASTDSPENLALMPLAAEYLLAKYPDDTYSYRRLAQLVESLGRALERPPRPSKLTGERAEYEGWIHDLLVAIAKKNPSTSRDPKATLDRTRAVLEKTRQRSHAAFDDELKRRLAALDPKSEKIGFDLSDLESAAHDHFERFDERNPPFHYKLLLLDWVVDKRARPYHGTKDKPHYTELWDLMQLIGEYSTDAESADQLPQVGEYLLKKYADDQYIGSQMKLRMEGLKTARRGELDPKTPQGAYAAEARALFKKIGAK